MSTIKLFLDLRWFVLEFSNEELYSLKMIVKEYLLELDDQIKNASGPDKNELEDFKIIVENVLLKLYQ